MSGKWFIEAGSIIVVTLVPSSNQDRTPLKCSQRRFGCWPRSRPRRSQRRGHFLWTQPGRSRTIQHQHRLVGVVDGLTPKSTPNLATRIAQLSSITRRDSTQPATRSRRQTLWILLSPLCVGLVTSPPRPTSNFSYHPTAAYQAELDGRAMFVVLRVSLANSTRVPFVTADLSVVQCERLAATLGSDLCSPRSSCDARQCHVAMAVEPLSSDFDRNVNR